jgi:rRNA processing protein Gar1
MNDLNGNTLSIGDDVIVYPKDYIGVVIDIAQDSDDVYYAVVADQDNDTYSVNAEFIELA